MSECGMMGCSGLHIALILGLMALGAESQFPIRYVHVPASCQDGDQEGKYLASVQTSCAQFYSCAPGHLAALMSCPSGTLFDLKMGMCLRDSAVDCGDRPRPTEEELLQVDVRVLGVPLRAGIVPSGGVHYQLMMSQAFTSDGLDIIACRRLQMGLERVLLRDPLLESCAVNGHRCSVPQFLCQATASPGQSHRIPNAVSLLNFINDIRKR